MTASNFTAATSSEDMVVPRKRTHEQQLELQATEVVEETNQSKIPRVAMTSPFLHPREAEGNGPKCQPVTVGLDIMNFVDDRGIFFIFY